MITKKIKKTKIVRFDPETQADLDEITIPDSYYGELVYDFWKVCNFERCDVNPELLNKDGSFSIFKFLRLVNGLPSENDRVFLWSFYSIQFDRQVHLYARYAIEKRRFYLVEEGTVM